MFSGDLPDKRCEPVRWHFESTNPSKGEPYEMKSNSEDDSRMPASDPGHIMKLKEFKLKFGSRKNDALERGGISLDIPPGDYRLLAVWEDTTSRGARESEWTGKLTSGEVNLSVAASDAKLEVAKPNLSEKEAASKP